MGAAVELNSAERLRLEGRLPWVEFHDDGDVLRLFSGDTWPSNTVALARFTAESADRRIAEVLAPHLKARVACNWVLGPLSQPADLARRMRNQGLSCRIHCAAMACDLNALPGPVASPGGVTIRLVDEPPSLVPLTTERRRRRHAGELAMARFEPRVVWHFSATADGRVVGETALFEGLEAAGLYNVQVLEHFRGRGIGSALVQAAVFHARKLGHDTAVLAATNLGLGVYTRVGFREVGKLSFWKYGKMRQLD